MGRSYSYSENEFVHFYQSDVEWSQTPGPRIVQLPGYLAVTVPYEPKPLHEWPEVTTTVTLTEAEESDAQLVAYRVEFPRLSAPEGWGLSGFIKPALALDLHIRSIAHTVTPERSVVFGQPTEAVELRYENYRSVPHTLECSVREILIRPRGINAGYVEVTYQPRRSDHASAVAHPVIVVEDKEQEGATMIEPQIAWPGLALFGPVICGDYILALRWSDDTRPRLANMERRRITVREGLQRHAWR
jgi:hypothetical protein